MLLTKINAFSGLTSNKTNRTQNSQTNNMPALNKTNAADSFTFKSRKGLVPKQLISKANTVVEKYLKLEAPVKRADWILGKTDATPEAKALAEEIRREGVKFETPVTIAGKEQICKAEVGNYINGHELCIDLGEGKEGRKFRISLNQDNKVTKKSEFKEMKNLSPSEIPEFIPLEPYATSKVHTLLDALAKV